jgi:hypothetical protein
MVTIAVIVGHQCFIVRLLIIGFVPDANIEKERNKMSNKPYLEKDYIEAADRLKILNDLKDTMISLDLKEEDIKQLKEAERISKEYFDGHYCLFRFTTNYRFIFGTPDLSDFCGGSVEYPAGKTLSEAVVNATKLEEGNIKQMMFRKAELEAEIGLINDLNDLIEKEPKFETEKIINQFRRDFSLVRDKKEKYKKCQLCGFTFKKKNGENYNEMHHIIPLSKNGKDAEINTLVLCANCHRQFHYASVDLSEFTKGIIKINGIQKKITIET